MTVPGDVEARIPGLRKRLEASVSGYVLVKRFGTPQKTALLVMKERGEVEVFESPAGRAYRLKKATS